MGLIIEMVYLLTSRVYSTECRVGLENQEFVRALKEDEATEKFKIFMRDNYQKQYQNFIVEDRPVVYYLHPKRDALSKFIKNANFLRNVKDFFGGINIAKRNSFFTKTPFMICFGYK